MATMIQSATRTMPLGYSTRWRRELGDLGIDGNLGISVSDVTGEIAKWQRAAEEAVKQATSYKQQLDATLAEVARLRALATGVFSDPASAVESFTFESEYTPTIMVDKPLAPAPPGTGSAIARAMKPRFTVNVKGIGPLKIAPFGDPTPAGKWPWIIGGGALLAALGAFGLSRSLIIGGTAGVAAGVAIASLK